MKIDENLAKVVIFYIYSTIGSLLAGESTGGDRLHIITHRRFLKVAGREQFRNL